MYNEPKGADLRFSAMFLNKNVKTISRLLDAGLHPTEEQLSDTIQICKDLLSALGYVKSY